MRRIMNVTVKTCTYMHAYSYNEIIMHYMLCFYCSAFNCMLAIDYGIK